MDAKLFIYSARDVIFLIAEDLFDRFRLPRFTTNPIEITSASHIGPCS